MGSGSLSGTSADSVVTEPVVDAESADSETDGFAVGSGVGMIGIAVGVDGEGVNGEGVTRNEGVDGDGDDRVFGSAVDAESESTSLLLDDDPEESGVIVVVVSAVKVSR